MVVNLKKVTRRVEFGSGVIQQLPEELLLEILCKVPPEELLRVCKYVCRSWFLLLDCIACDRLFINSNLLHSTLSIVFRDRFRFALMSNIRIARLKSEQNSTSASSQFEFCRLDINWLRNRVSSPKFYDDHVAGKIHITSSDGALLISSKERDACVVVNPLTRQLVKLPHIRPCCKDCALVRYGAIARIPDTAKFKVLAVGADKHASSYVWYVLTVGISMSWEVFSNIPSEFIPSTFNWPCESNSVSISGVIYVPFYTAHDNFTFAAIDLVNEKAYSLEIPAKLKAKQRTSPPHCRTWKLVQTDKYLGCAGIKDYGAEVMGLWILKDFRRSEWTMILNIDFLSSPEIKRRRFAPQIWLESSQTLVMHVEWHPRSLSDEGYMAYFVHTKKFEGLTCGSDCHVPFLHRNSLAPLF